MNALSNTLVILRSDEAASKATLQSASERLKRARLEVRNALDAYERALASHNDIRARLIRAMEGAA